MLWPSPCAPAASIMIRNRAAGSHQHSVCHTGGPCAMSRASCSMGAGPQCAPPAQPSVRALSISTTLRIRLYSSPTLRIAPLQCASAANSQSAPASDRKVAVLFVCLGNICRSPAAEATFRQAVQRAGLEDQFSIASCGTGGGNPDWYAPGGFSYHHGDPADGRMRQAASWRGIDIVTRSKPLAPSDLAAYDYIIGMDQKNQRAMMEAAEFWRQSPQGKEVVPADYGRRISLMTSYVPPGSKYEGTTSVPDPYYGGESGFDLVLDLLESACQGLLTRITQDRGLVAGQTRLK